MKDSVMSILIVDDEPLARMRLKSMLEHLNFHHILEAQHGKEGINMVAKYLPDLVFMDIEMPELGGIEAATLIREKYPSIPIIFSTAHDEFALKAFDISAADYLLKPLSIERLKQAIDKVGLSCMDDKIKAKRGNDVIMVSVNDIICLVAEDKYVTAHLPDQSILLDLSLAEIEESYAIFLRIHRSTLINTHHLKGIHNKPGQSTLAILENTTIQPAISRRQLSAVKKILKEL